MIVTDISAQTPKVLSIVNSLTSPQHNPILPPLAVLSCPSAYQDPGRHSDQGCSVLPMCLFAPYPTSWHGKRHSAPQAPQHILHAGER